MTYLQDLRNKVKRKLFFSIDKPKRAILKNLPTEWEEFTKGDSICLIDQDKEDISIVLYKAPKGLKFDLHYHSPQVEFGAIIYGKVKILTVDVKGDYEIKYLKAGDSFSFARGEAHHFEFLENTFIQLTYAPSFKSGWQAMNQDII